MSKNKKWFYRQLVETIDEVHGEIADLDHIFLNPIDTLPIEKEKPKFIEEYRGQKIELRSAIQLLKDFCERQEGCDYCTINQSEECPFNKKQSPEDWEIPDILYDSED